MIFDANTHIGHWPFRRLHTSTADGLLRLLDNAGIEKAAVSHTHAVFYRDPHEANAELFEALKPYRDRLIPLATLNPEYAAWQDDLAECVESFGFPALRLFPTYHRYDLCGDTAARLLAEADRRNLPVSVCCAFEDPRQRHPLDTAPDLIEHPIATAVRRFPNVRFLITNAALSTVDMVIRHLPHQGNVSFDLSALPGPESDAARKAYDLLGPQRLLLGTHAPFKYPQVTLLRAHSTGATGPELDSILGQNAVRFFG